MARLTNTDLHNEIKLVTQELNYVKDSQAKMQEDITMIKKKFLSLSLNKKNKDLIIWPETATISYLLQNNKSHLKFIHSDFKPFSCDLCSMKFKMK